jgi:hypothetical protein
MEADRCANKLFLFRYYENWMWRFSIVTVSVLIDF